MFEELKKQYYRFCVYWLGIKRCEHCGSHNTKQCGYWGYNGRLFCYDCKKQTPVNSAPCGGISNNEPPYLV